VSSTTLQEVQTPPHGGQAFDHSVQFMPTLREEEYLSLLGALGAGYARLTVSSPLVDDILLLFRRIHYGISKFDECVF